MKKTIASALFMAAAMMAPAASAAETEGIVQFTVNEVTVYPMMDSAGQMAASIFKGPLSPEEVAAYMPGGQAPAGVNVFLLKTPTGNVLIDAGWGKSGPGGAALTEKLQLAGLSPDDIDAVILTHMHSDHIGGLLDGDKAFLSKAKIMVSASELAANSQPRAAIAVIAPPVPVTGGETPEESAAPQPEPAVTPPPAAPAEKPMPQVVIEAYGERIVPFEFGAEIIPGLTAVDAVGHTPGHTALRLKSGDQELLFIGDLLHAAALQFPEPEECATYDNDMTMAVISRKGILKMASAENLAVAGAHIPFPGMGFVKAEGQGFVFTPVMGD